MPSFAPLCICYDYLKRALGQPSPTIDDCLIYFDSEDDFRPGCRNIGHCYQQLFPEVHSPGRSHLKTKKFILYFPGKG